MCIPPLVLLCCHQGLPQELQSCNGMYTVQYCMYTTPTIRCNVNLFPTDVPLNVASFWSGILDAVHVTGEVSKAWVSPVDA